MQRVEKIKNWAEEHLSTPKAAGETIGRIIPDIIVGLLTDFAFSGGKAGGKVAKEIAEESLDSVKDAAVREIAEEGADSIKDAVTKEVIKEVKEETAEKAAKEIVEKATKEIGEKTGKEVSEKTIKELTEETAKKARKAVDDAVEEAVKKAGEGGSYSSFGEMSFKDGKRYSAWNKLREEGLTFEQAEKIKYIEKGQKPAPETYLSGEYIENHLQSFKDSGAVKIMPNEPSGTIGGKGGTFVMSGDELDEIIQYANGDVSKIEGVLGLDPGYLGKNPVIVMMDDSSNVRMPSGNELGAWPEYWEPGGYTSGGIKEAVIDPVPEGEYTYKFLFE